MLRGRPQHDLAAVDFGFKRVWDPTALLTSQQWKDRRSGGLSKFEWSVA